VPVEAHRLETLDGALEQRFVLLDKAQRPSIAASA
jgi:hypothetical protein